MDLNTTIKVINKVTIPEISPQAKLQALSRRLSLHIFTKELPVQVKGIYMCCSKNKRILILNQQLNDEQKLVAVENIILETAGKSFKLYAYPNSNLDKICRIWGGIDGRPKEYSY